MGSSLKAVRSRAAGAARATLAICMLAAAAALASSCSIQVEEFELTVDGLALEPRIAANEAACGIVYYWTSPASSTRNVCMATVNAKGSVIENGGVVGSQNFPYKANRLSNLVWNGRDGQFAFAYTSEKVLNFLRFDKDLKQIGSPLVISFPGIAPSDDRHPWLEYPSLVWNSNLGEYCLAYVTVESPAYPDRHNDVYVSRISSAGAYVHAGHERAHVADCPYDASFPSLSFHRGTGAYYIAYVKHGYSTLDDRLMMGRLSLPSYSLAEKEIMAGWRQSDRAQGALLLYDPASGFAAMAMKAGEACVQKVDQGCVAIGSYMAKPGSGAVWPLTASYLTGSSFLLCDGIPGGGIKGWLFDASGHQGDFIMVNGGIQPSVDGMRMAYSKNQHLYYGRIKIGGSGGS